MHMQWLQGRALSAAGENRQEQRFGLATSLLHIRCGSMQCRYACTASGELTLCRDALYHMVTTLKCPMERMQCQNTTIRCMHSL